MAEVKSRAELVEEFTRKLGGPVGERIDAKLGVVYVVPTTAAEIQRNLEAAEAAKKEDALRSHAMVSVAGMLKTVSASALSTWSSGGKQDTRVFRMHLMLEELAEVVIELARREEANLLKELADLLYVVYGTAVAFGLPIDAMFDEVHASNMTKNAGAFHDRSGSKGKDANYKKADPIAVLARHREEKKN